MLLHEYKKISKIIDEVSMYLLKKGYYDFNLDVKVIKNQEVTITFKSSLLSDEIIEKIKKYVGKKREMEMEEYGWELLGESDSSSDFEMISYLVDSIDIQNIDNSSVITLHRKYVE